MELCLTTGPLLHGASAAIVQIWMLIFSHRVLNSWLFSGEPNTEVHISIKFFTITSLCLLLITQDAINLVRWSIKQRNHVLEAHSLKSSATVSLKRFTWKKLTVDLGLSFLYLKHISVMINFTLIICINSLSSTLASFSKDTSFDTVGWLDSLFSFKALLHFLFLSSFLNSSKNQTIFSWTRTFSIFYSFFKLQYNNVQMYKTLLILLHQKLWFSC